MKTVSTTAILALLKMTTKQQLEYLPMLAGMHKSIEYALTVVSTGEYYRPTYPLFEIAKKNTIDTTKVLQVISNTLGVTTYDKTKVVKVTEVERLIIELAVSPLTFKLRVDTAKQFIQPDFTLVQFLKTKIPKYIAQQQFVTPELHTCHTCGNSAKETRGNVCRTCIGIFRTFCDGRNYAFTIPKNNFNFHKFKEAIDAPIELQIHHWEFFNTKDEVVVTPTGHPKRRLDIPLEFEEFIRPIVKL